MKRFLNKKNISERIDVSSVIVENDNIVQNKSFSNEKAKPSKLIIDFETMDNAIALKHY